MYGAKALFAPSTWIRCVSVEPSYFLYLFAWNTLEFVNTNLYLQKACRPNATGEPDLRTPCDDEERGVTFVAHVNANVHSAKMLTVLVLSIFFTSWSEAAGKRRKLFILLPMAGQLLEILLMGAYTVRWSSPPLLAALSEACLHVLFGNFAYVELFAYLHICDVSAPENRTMRMGILSALHVVARLLGKGVSGFVLHAAGFLASYALCLALTAGALFAGWRLIADRRVAARGGGSPCDAFSVCRAVESLRIVFGRGTARLKTAVTLLLLTQTILYFIREGEFTVMYLYLRYRFHWNEEMYSLFLAYGCLGIFVGTLLTSVLLSKILKIHDGILAIFSSVWDLGIIVAYFYASANWQLYLVSGMDLFFGVSLTVSYSYMSKFFGDHEQGHLFSVSTMFSLLIPFCHPTYNIIFEKTLNTFPYSIFAISLVLYIFVITFNCIIYGLTKDLVKTTETEDTNKIPPKCENDVHTVKI